MTPIVDGLEQEYGGQIVVQRINADQGDGPAIMRTYKILGHPTLLIFDNEQQEVQRLVGPRPAHEVEILVQDALKKSHSQKLVPTLRVSLGRGKFNPEG